MAMPTLTINKRYQVRSQPIGQGGMGVVYKAYDIMTKREVALKTMRGMLQPEALQLFSKEWTLLAQVSHPNIVDILDTGEFEENGEIKPFFVMPLLPGVTLDKLIENSGARLTTERVVGIAAQTCRGLHAAHERGLIHRDIKPSNIFVMDDDTVKIIDFGVVHLAGAESVTGLKGTLQYMAPEQIEMSGSSAASDIFSLGVVCYQTLTGRKPFARDTEGETVEAIRKYIPPPVYELNPLVSQTVSRVIHKAMAKAPWHRFSSAKEFGETLQKAMNNQPIERFDHEKIQPRIERAKKTQLEGDYQFASEILAELEAEGHIDPEITVLRIQLDQAIRQKSIRQLLDGARIRLEEDEFPLALQKIQQVLQIDPGNSDAFGLRKQIEKQSGEKQAQAWFRLVEEHLANHSFGQAKQALQEILKLNPSDSRARKMLADVNQREEEAGRLHSEKEELYQSAVGCYQQGEISSALSKLERVLELHSQSPATAIPDRAAQYQTFYNQVRTEREAARDAYAEGRRYLTDKNFAKALEVCTGYLNKSPGDRMFQALKLEVEERQRQEQSSFIAEVSRLVEGEADLDRRVSILKEAVERYPEEPHFQQSLRLMRERRDLVNGIVAKAGQYEERGQFNEALGQFDILRNIYAQYPALEFETERLRKRRDERVREESKARFIEQIQRNLTAGNYSKARDLIRTALGEFPQDEELSSLEQLVQRESDGAAEADEWFQRGQGLASEHKFAEAVDALRKAVSLDNRNAIVRGALVSALVEGARAVLEQDWRAAEPLIDEALAIDEGNDLAKNLQGRMLDRKRQEVLTTCLSQVRELRAQGDITGALAKIDEAIRLYPNEARLAQLRRTLQPRDEAAIVAPQPTRRPEPAQPVQPKEAAPVKPPAAVAGSNVEMNRHAETVCIPPPEAAPIPAPEMSALQLSRSALPTPAVPQPNVQPANVREDSLQKPATPIAAPAAGRGRAFAKVVWGVVATAAVLLAFAFIVTYLHKIKPPPPVVQRDFVVDLKSNILDVTYRVDGKPPASQPLHLPPGTHTVEASAPGYTPETKSIALDASSPKPYVVEFQLAPELVHIKLSSTLKAGKVALDGGEPEDLQEGQFVREGITLSADHTLSLTQPGKEPLTFSFRAEPGKIVTLTAPLKAKDLTAVVISNLSSSARVYSSGTNSQAAFNDQPPQPIPPEGLDRNNLPENSAVTVDDGKLPRRLTIEKNNAPTLSVLLLAADPDHAEVQIESNVPGAQLFVNGKKWTVFKKEKSWTVLWPGPNTLWAEKEGYQRSAEQKLEIKKGDVITNLQVFELKPVVRTGTLVIDGATPQASVLIDNIPVGSTGEDGAFRREGIQPGVHTLTLKKGDFEDKQLSKTFIAGQEIHLSGADGQLTPFGSLDFRVSPPSASVTYKRADETQSHTSENNRSVRVRAGRYVVSASASGFQQRQDNVTVEAGKSLTIGWPLPPQPATVPTPAPPPPPPPERYFDDQNAWTQNEDWLIHKGQATSWLVHSQGVFRFDFMRQPKSGPLKGVLNLLLKERNRKVEWVVDDKDTNNLIAYTLDFKTIERRVMSNGKAGSKQSVKLPAAVATDESYPLQLEITPERIVIKDAQGKELDTYQRPDPAVPLGRFGFKGEVVLKVSRK
jgi:eukaryotic-like serine/threonine-protein kinase